MQLRAKWFRMLEIAASAAGSRLPAANTVVSTNADGASNSFNNTSGRGRGGGAGFSGANPGFASGSSNQRGGSYNGGAGRGGSRVNPKSTTPPAMVSFNLIYYYLRVRVENNFSSYSAADRQCAIVLTKSKLLATIGIFLL